MRTLSSLAFVAVVVASLSCKDPVVPPNACGNTCGCFPVDCGNGSCCEMDYMCTLYNTCEWVGPPTPDPNGEFDEAKKPVPDAGSPPAKTHPEHPQRKMVL